MNFHPLQSFEKKLRTRRLCSLLVLEQVDLKQQQALVPNGPIQSCWQWFKTSRILLGQKSVCVCVCVSVYDRKILDILLNWVLPLCPYIIVPYCGKDMIHNNNNRPLSELFPSFIYTLSFNWVLKCPSLILFLFLKCQNWAYMKSKMCFPKYQVSQADVT